MPLTVLTDQNVRDVLNTLTRDDVFSLHRSLADGLHNYSTAEAPEDSGCCASNQPSRISIRLRDGATTLFMPATSDAGIGCKVVTLQDSATPSDNSSSNSLSLPSRSSISSSHASISSGRSSSPSNSESTRSGRSDTFSSERGSTSSRTSRSNSRPSTPVAKIINPKDPLPDLDDRTATSPQGTLTLLTPTGQPRALISASTLTAFRTALSTTLLLKLRHHAHTLTVFGAGNQAYWHILLTLIILGPTKLHHLNVINRDFTRAQRLFMSLAKCPNKDVQDAFMGGKLRPGILTPEYGEYDRLLKEQVRAADILYCCTPSTKPLFPGSHLTSTEGRRKARYVAAVGSYKPHMQELPTEVLLQAVTGPEEGHPHRPHIHHKAAGEGGAVIVDSIEGAMKESGEIIKAGIRGRGVVELGELVMLKRSYWAEKAEREAQAHREREQKGTSKASGGGHGLGHLFHRQHKDHPPESDVIPDGGLKDWLARGNVVYKSVGIGLMDVVVGLELVKLAEERGIGTHVEDF